MSRSRKKFPIGGNCADNYGGQHKWKQYSQRRLRRAVRVAIRKGELILPTLKGISNIWASPQDGKSGWWPDAPDDAYRK